MDQPLFKYSGALLSVIVLSTIVMIWGLGMNEELVTNGMTLSIGILMFSLEVVSDDRNNLSLIGWSVIGVSGIMGLLDLLVINISYMVPIEYITTAVLFVLGSYLVVSGITQYPSNSSVSE